VLAERVVMAEDRADPDGAEAAAWALDRFRLARLRQTTSGCRLWALDELVAMEGLAALDPDVDLAGSATGALEALSSLGEVALAGGAELHDELMPIVVRLVERDPTAGERLRAVRESLTLATAYDAFTRERPRQFAVLRQTAKRKVLIGPDVRAAGLVGAEPEIEDRPLGEVSEISFTLEPSIGEHLAQVRYWWPSSTEELDAHRGWSLWHGLAGLVAANAPGRAQADAYASGRALRSHLLGGELELPMQPPEAPALYIGSIDDSNFDPIRMTAEPGGTVVRMTAMVPTALTTFVVALGAARTEHSGALAAAFTFAHQAPIEAAALLEELAGSDDSGSLRRIATGLRERSGILGLDGAVTPAMWSIRVARSARERLSANVLQTLRTSRPGSLAAVPDRAAQVERRLQELLEIDRLLSR
jgi:hypothetical protein